MALLNEMPHITGGIDIKGSIFYVSQEPWLFPASLQENILFGKPYNEEKFKKIVKSCCLDKVYLRRIFW